MSHFRFDVVFKLDLGYYRRGHKVAACCCKSWRDVRAALRYYGREKVAVFKVRWQPYRSWKHDKRKPTPQEIAALNP